MVGLQVSKKFLDKIKDKEEKFEKENDQREFGGWLVIKKSYYDDDIIDDVFFDEEYQDSVYVNFGTRILELPEKERHLVKGWFHRHPINDMSGLDISTSTKLTKFWDKCFTVVLLGNGELLVCRSEKSTDFNGNYQPMITFRKKIDKWRELNSNGGILSKITGRHKL